MPNTLFFFFFIFLILFPLIRTDDSCKVARCSNRGPQIRFPFHLQNIQQSRCGYRGFSLSCSNRQTLIHLPNSVSMVVTRIDYLLRVIHLQDPTNCVPRQLTNLNLTNTQFRYSTSSSSNLTNFDLYYCWENAESFIPVPCLGAVVYAVRSGVNVSFNSCSRLTFESNTRATGVSSVPDDIFRDQQDLALNWGTPNCSECESRGEFCSFRNGNDSESSGRLELQCLQPKSAQGSRRNIVIAGSVSGVFVFVVVVVALYWFFIMRKKDKRKLDKFAEDYRDMNPTRYTFSDIKKITNKFKEKLGEGAYGTVFKGKLSSEILVAVKLLSGSTGIEEDFVKEVKTLCTIHHLNVVRLVGFCAEGNNRALVYEFLPNDSLEKFIFSENEKRSSLGWDKIQDIAIGTAKGIECLHQGRDRRILHLDIKPHNVLLDQNFVPKIADFGLAKLCSSDQSIVSMTAASGTMGYLAPEIFSRNFGNVSYKSDVYSFGMVLLEIVGAGKNIDVAVQNPDQAHFPEWIYNRLVNEEGKNIWFEETEDEAIPKKLTLVGLWCIQMKPTDRPSMKNIVRMLEGNGEGISMPPNPFASTIPNKSSVKTSAGAFDIDLAGLSR